MAAAIDRRGVDPVDAVVYSRVKRLDARRIVLSAPHPSADGPGAEPDRRDLESRGSQWSSLHPPIVEERCRRKTRPIADGAGRRGAVGAGPSGATWCAPKR